MIDGEALFWLTLAGLMTGAIAGYHIGLKRAAAAFQAAGLPEAAIPARLIPIREAAILDCIKAVRAVRPKAAGESAGDMAQARWIQHGVAMALEALHSIDKRPPGLYGAPREIADAISRRALSKEEGASGGGFLSGGGGSAGR
jgi:hypothetical protein